VGAERTFFEDISDPTGLAAALETVLDALMERIARAGSAGRTVTLKVKYSDFHQITRARSFTVPISDRSAIGAAGQGLLAALCPVPLGVRLLGLTLSALSEDEGEESGPGYAQLGLSL
jgi:DNA polymerase-4